MKIETLQFQSEEFSKENQGAEYDKLRALGEVLFCCFLLEKKVYCTN